MERSKYYSCRLIDKALSFIIIALALTSAIVSANSPSSSSKTIREKRATMKDNLAKEEVVPHVIDAIPNEEVAIKYPSGVEVSYGNELKPIQVKDQPIVDWAAKDGALYTVAMVDPDAPSRRDPTSREWLHWLVVNIPGKDISKGETLAAYVGSGPPKDTGLHRYVFIVYAQNGHHIESSLKLTNTSADGRGKYSIKGFAKQHHLQPLAANFYQAKYDDYVPILYKQLRAE